MSSTPGIYKNNEINWLSVLQGFAMLLVVIGHVTHGEGELTRIIYSFHMPLFMCISGYLFRITAIEKNKRYLDVIFSKSVRLLIPYFAFGVATIFLKVAFSGYMHRSASISISQLMDAFVWLTNMPLGEMWFINTLYFMFLLYPIYIIASKSAIGDILMLVFFGFIYCLKPDVSSVIFDFNHVSRMGVYFYAGMIASRIEFEKRLPDTGRGGGFWRRNHPNGAGE